MSKRILLLISGLLWSASGTKILVKGISFFVRDLRLWVIALCLLIAVGFFMMFSKVSGKYIQRILHLEGERFPLYKLMSLKGYLVFAFMISFGITLGHIPGMPLGFFASVYPGLGFGLLSGGLRFFLSTRNL